MRNAAAVPALGLLSGAAAGLILGPPQFVPAAAVLATAAIAAVWSWHRWRSMAMTAWIGIAFFAGGVVLSIDAWQQAWRPSLRTVFEDLATQQRADASRGRRPLPEDHTAFAVVVGVIRADAFARPNGASLSLDVTSIEQPRGSLPLSGASIRVRGGVLLGVGGALAADRVDQWRAGRLVRVPVLLRRPSRYLNPGVPDGERSLARSGTILVGSVKSAALVELLARGGWLSEAAGGARNFVRQAADDAVGRWSRRSAAIVTAILIGDRAGLDDALEARLQEAGTYHVIAISGGNIAILAGLGIAAFRLAGLLGRTAMISAIVVLLAYAYLVGGGASVNRATMMAAIYFAARAIDLRGPPANALALASGLLAAADPLAILDPGFLLTFAATCAILATASIARLAPVPRFVVPAVAMLVASVAAEAVLFPIAGLIFSRITVAGLVLNFAAIPLMAVVQVAGMASVFAFALWPPLAYAIGWFAHAAAEGLVRSADLVRIAPALTWRVAPPGWPVVTIYYVGLVAGWTLWRGSEGDGSAAPAYRVVARRLAIAAAIVSAVCIAAEPWVGFPAADGRLHVTFLDVGQGDAALVRFPRGATLLVDSGGLGSLSPFDIGDRVVAPVLRHAGIHRLDSVAITHGDLDHAGGSVSIVREFRPRDVWEGIPVPRLPVLRDLRAAALAVGARWVNLQANDRLSIDDVEVVAWHPGLADWERQRVRNDDSIVLELSWHDVSIVLTGDIGRDVERELGPRFTKSPLRVVKVPHHGSLTSSSREFVEALSPRVAVVSVGRGNTFGHPAPEVLNHYRQAGAQIFRTDQDGAVELTTDGHLLEIGTFSGRRVLVRSSLPRRQEGDRQAIWGH